MATDPWNLSPAETRLSLMAMTSPGFSTPFLLSSPISGMSVHLPMARREGGPCFVTKDRSGESEGALGAEGMEMEEMKGRPEAKIPVTPSTCHL